MCFLLALPSPPEPRIPKQSSGKKGGAWEGGEACMLRGRAGADLVFRAEERKKKGGRRRRRRRRNGKFCIESFRSPPFDEEEEVGFYREEEARRRPGFPLPHLSPKETGLKFAKSARSLQWRMQARSVVRNTVQCTACGWTLQHPY